MFNNSDFDLILNDFNNNKNSHSYIFYTNDFFACRNDINNLVKKIFSVENIDEVLSDFIVISSDDKKNILKDDVYRLKELFQNKSYLNKKRIYLIEEAHKLNPTSANMILKFLEEPSPGVVGLFITTNLDSVLTTIKSRCQIVNCFYELKNCEYNESDYNIIESLFNDNKYINIFTVKKKFEKYDRNKLIDLFNNYLIKCYNNLSDDLILDRIKILNKVIGMLNNNVSVDYVFDYLFLEGSD